MTPLKRMFKFIPKPSAEAIILTKIILYSMSGFISIIRKAQSMLEMWGKGELPEDFDRG